MSVGAGPCEGRLGGRGVAQSFRQAAVEPHPAFELTLRWLRRNALAAAAIAFAHGDYRNRNLLVGEEGLRAVFERKPAHVGDPFEDLGWMCVRFWRCDVGALPVGGIGPREPFYEA